MKAKKYTTAVLTVLIFGFTTMNGQRAVRSESQVQRKQTTVKEQQTRTRQQSEAKVQRKPAQTQQMQRQVQTKKVQRQPAQTQKTQRQVHTKQVQRQPTQTQKTQRQVHTKQVERQPKHQSSNSKEIRQHKPRENQVAYNKRPTSISTSKNPRSDYRTPETKVYAKHKTYAKENYYSGHHYHHTRPAGRIKTHYHHNTYINHYNVLYYPAYHEIYWTRNMYRDYRRWYPNYRWRYDYGYRINTISVFDAKYNMGEVSMVYGRVYATWHNRETDDYLLFFGGDFPNQQFTAVLPGRIARKFNWRPERYFLGEHLTITGLITTYDGSPEIIVKNTQQVAIY